LDLRKTVTEARLVAQFRPEVSGERFVAFESYEDTVGPLAHVCLPQDIDSKGKLERLEGNVMGSLS
jgi:hypothetical protein